MGSEYTKRQPGSIPFGEDWARFARRQSEDRRLQFFDTFLKMAGGWTPDASATDDELDDYDRMERLISAYLNGKSGGRPPKTDTPPSKPISKPLSKPPTKTLKKELNRLEGLEETSAALARGKRQPPTIDQFVDGGKLAGVPEDFARPFYDELVAAGWQDADGLYVANWRRYLKSAWRDDQKKISGARGSQPVGGISLDDIPDVR